MSEKGFYVKFKTKDEIIIEMFPTKEDMEIKGVNSHYYFFWDDTMVMKEIFNSPMKRKDYIEAIEMGFMHVGTKVLNG